MGNLIATILVACAAFAFLVLALSLSALMGRARKRRCACAESKIVMKTVMDREKAKRAARLYRPDGVDPRRLPVLSAELAEEISSKKPAR